MQKRSLDYFLTDAFSGTHPITAESLREFLISSFGSVNLQFVTDSINLTRNHDVVGVQFDNSNCYLELPLASGDDNGVPFSGKRFRIFNPTQYDYEIRKSPTSVSGISFQGVENVSFVAKKFTNLEVVSNGESWLVTSYADIASGESAQIDIITANISAIQGAVTALQVAMSTKADKYDIDSMQLVVDSIILNQSSQLNQIQSLTTSVSDLQSNVTALGGQVTSVEGRTTSLETIVNDLQSQNLDSRLDSVENLNATQESRLTAIETKNTTQDSRLTAIETQNTTQDATLVDVGTRLSAVEALDISQGASILDHGSRISSIESSISANGVKNTEQDSRLTAIESKNTTQDSRLDSIDVLNTTQNSRLDSIDVLNATQNSRLDSIETENANQSTRLTSVESLNTAQNSRLDSIETKNTTQDSRLDSVESRSTALESKYDTNGRLKSEFLPVGITGDNDQVFVKTTIVEMNAITTMNVGDTCIVRGSVNKNYIWDGTAWQEYNDNGILSVNGKTGSAITLNIDELADPSAKLLTTSQKSILSNLSDYMSGITGGVTTGTTDARYLEYSIKNKDTGVATTYRKAILPTSGTGILKWNGTTLSWGATIADAEIASGITASKITQTASYRFVTDTEKTTWNSKVDSSTLSNYLLKTDFSYYNKFGSFTTASGVKWDGANFVPDTNTYATQSWVSSQGYLTSSSLSSYYTQTQINEFFSATTAITGYNKSNWDTAYGWGNHASAGYLTSASLSSYYTSTQVDSIFSGSTAKTGYNKTNWDTAFGWGNHASAGYLTSITESQVKTALSVSSTTDFTKEEPETIISVRLASTANFAIATGGVATAIDSVTPAVGDLVLLKNQTATGENGVYVVNSGAWTRYAGYQTITDLSSKSIIVTAGSTQTNTIWASYVAGTFTLGTTNPLIDRAWQYATTSIKGVASYSSTFFSVASGVVSLITGSTTAGVSPSNLRGTAVVTTAGMLPYVASSTQFTGLAIGASGTFLKSTGTAPSWASLTWADIGVGAGTNGQTLKSNGTTAVWGSIAWSEITGKPSFAVNYTDNLDMSSLSSLGDVVFKTWDGDSDANAPVTSGLSNEGMLLHMRSKTSTKFAQLAVNVLSSATKWMVRSYDTSWSSWSNLALESWVSSNFASSTHNHNETYEPTITKSTGVAYYTGSAWSFVTTLSDSNLKLGNTASDTGSINEVYAKKFTSPVTTLTLASNASTFDTALGHCAKLTLPASTTQSQTITLTNIPQLTNGYQTFQIEVTQPSSGTISNNFAFVIKVGTTNAKVPTGQDLKPTQSNSAIDIITISVINGVPYATMAKGMV